MTYNDLINEAAKKNHKYQYFLYSSFSFKNSNYNNTYILKNIIQYKFKYLIL